MGQEKSAENIPNDILSCLIEMGIDTVDTLNACESKYLNCRFNKDKGSFDFCGKKVAFLKGNTGTIKSTKKDFFDREKYYIDIKGFLPVGSWQLIIFDTNEAKQIGYDAVIVYSSKKLLSTKEVMKRLSCKH